MYQNRYEGTYNGRPINKIGDYPKSQAARILQFIGEKWQTYDVIEEHVKMPSRSLNKQLSRLTQRNLLEKRGFGKSAEYRRAGK